VNGNVLERRASVVDHRLKCSLRICIGWRLAPPPLGWARAWAATATTALSQSKPPHDRLRSMPAPGLPETDLLLLSALAVLQLRYQPQQQGRTGTLHCPYCLVRKALRRELTLRGGAPARFWWAIAHSAAQGRPRGQQESPDIRASSQIAYCQLV